MIEEKELKKVHPALRWIISVPVRTGGRDGRTVAVMNVDGLTERPSDHQLQGASLLIPYFSHMIGMIVSSTAGVREGK